eukprot:SAG11_NODE_738_length_7426_cov_14.966289_6_plen_68_part_00
MLRDALGVSSVPELAAEQARVQRYGKGGGRAMDVAGKMCGGFPKAAIYLARGVRVDLEWKNVPRPPP